MNDLIAPFITTTGQINSFLFEKDGHRFEAFIQQEVYLKIQKESERIWEQFTSGNKAEKAREEAEQAIYDDKEAKRLSKEEAKAKRKAMKKHAK